MLGQWIIDIIQEWVLSLSYATVAWVQAQGYATEAWVQSQGYLTAGYVDRGPLSGFDWELGDFTRDGAWHDHDLSAVVPAGAKAVLFQCFVRAPGVNMLFTMKKKGMGPAWYSARATTMVANLSTVEDLICACDTDRKIEYNATALTWTLIRLTVKGWWL